MINFTETGKKNQNDVAKLFRAQFLPSSSSSSSSTTTSNNTIQTNNNNYNKIQSFPIVYRDQDVAVISKPHHFATTGIIVNDAGLFANKNIHG